MPSTMSSTSNLTYPSECCSAICIAVAAHGMVISVMLHMFRVFLTGSYKKPREFNWAVGVILLLRDIFPQFHRLPLAVGSVGILGCYSRDEPWHAQPLFWDMKVPSHHKTLHKLTMSDSHSLQAQLWGPSTHVEVLYFTLRCCTTFSECLNGFTFLACA